MGGHAERARRLLVALPFDFLLALLVGRPLGHRDLIERPSLGIHGCWLLERLGLLRLADPTDRMRPGVDARLPKRSGSRSRLISDRSSRSYDEAEGVAGETTRQALHQLVDELLEDQAELAHAWIQDLRDTADTDGPPLDPEALASLDRGLADLAAGRVKPLAEYEREQRM